MLLHIYNKLYFPDIAPMLLWLRGNEDEDIAVFGWHGISLPPTLFRFPLLRHCIYLAEKYYHMSGYSILFLTMFHMHILLLILVN